MAMTHTYETEDRNRARGGAVRRFNAMDEEALLRVVAEQDELVLSRPILDELLGVLARKFGREAEELDAARRGGTRPTTASSNAPWRAGRKP